MWATVPSGAGLAGLNDPVLLCQVLRDEQPTPREGNHGCGYCSAVAAGKLLVTDRKAKQMSGLLDERRCTGPSPQKPEGIVPKDEANAKQHVSRAICLPCCRCSRECVLGYWGAEQIDPSSRACCLPPPSLCPCLALIWATGDQRTGRRSEMKTLSVAGESYEYSSGARLCSHNKARHLCPVSRQARRHAFST